jgi:hypothetical protein
VTPAEFAGAYKTTAEQVWAGTGIAPSALLAQWANETGWGTSWAGAPFNLANIENNGRVVLYPSLAVFVQACVATWHNGFYSTVLAARTANDQLAAIVASPWSAGHYGGSLAGFYAPFATLFNESGGQYVPTIDDIYNLLNAVNTQTLGRLEGEIVALNNMVDSVNKQTLGRIEGEIVALKAQIAALPVGGGLTAAQAQALTEAHDAIARIEAALKGA